MAECSGNAWKAYAREYGSGFLAMVAVAHRAEPYPLMRDGKPIIFANLGAARRAAHEHIVWLLNKPMYAEVYGRRLSEQEKLQETVFGSVAGREEVTPEKTFGVLYKKGRNGSSKAVQVQRKRRRRAHVPA